MSVNTQIHCRIIVSNFDYATNDFTEILTQLRTITRSDVSDGGSLKSPVLVYYTIALSE